VTAAADHDSYLAAVADDDQRRALSDLRRQIAAMLPGAIECISYAMPAFRQPGRKGKVVIGYAAFSRHCAIYPHSGTVIPGLAGELAGWKTSKSGVLFTADRPLPAALIRRIIDARLAEIGS
jgi:uncharacterized protein YdhG (YjbR/CyaY superfamily)